MKWCKQFILYVQINLKYMKCFDLFVSDGVYSLLNNIEIQSYKILYTKNDFHTKQSVYINHLSSTVQSNCVLYLLWLILKVFQQIIFSINNNFKKHA